MTRPGAGWLIGIVLLGVAATIAFTSAHSQLRVPLSEDDESRGRAAAPLVLLEFTDYQCPYCRHFESGTWPQLKQTYVDTGKVRFIVRDLPLDFHARAEPAAQAAHCAGAQHAFWPMHDALLAEGASLSEQAIEQAAQALGLDVARLRACIDSGRFRDDIQHNEQLARSLGLNGTPAFVLGRVKDGALLGRPLEGALPFEQFRAAIEEALKRR